MKQTAPPSSSGGASRGAAPEAKKKATVGGVEFVVGGWGRYEASLRQEQWRQGRRRPGLNYAGRSYVGAGDAVRSLLSGGAPDAQPLRIAARRLARALGRLEDGLCSPDEDGAWECAPIGARRSGAVVVPVLVSSDLAAFAASPTEPADAEALRSLGAAVLEVAAAAGAPLPAIPELVARGDRFPPLPPTLVPVSDDEGVLQLESEVRPHVEALEGLQAAVADRMDRAAGAVEALVGRRGGAERRAGRPGPRAAGARPRAGAAGDRPRADAVAAAAKAAPPLEAPLPFAGTRAFSADGRGGAAGEQLGPLFGVAFPAPSDGATCLTPAAVAWAARATGQGAYAWVVFDSPEVRAALRAPAGRAGELDPEALAGWLRARLGGSAPGVPVDAYLAHLRGLGLDVVERRASGRALFRPADVAPDLGRSGLAALLALPGPELLAFDWGEFDAGREAAAPPGAWLRVAIDCQARRVGAPEARQGAPQGSWLAPRAPDAGRGGPAPPTLTELQRCLVSAGLGLAWTLLAAPEGTYAVRPAAATAAAFARDPGLWPELCELAAGPLTRARMRAQDIAELADAGFIAVFRPAPGGTGAAPRAAPRAAPGLRARPSPGLPPPGSAKALRAYGGAPTWS
jgi:hypothetical protein